MDAVTDLFGNPIDEPVRPVTGAPNKPQQPPHLPVTGMTKEQPIRPCAIFKEDRDITWIINT